MARSIRLRGPGIQADHVPILQLERVERNGRFGESSLHDRNLLQRRQQRGKAVGAHAVIAMALLGPTLPR